MWINHSLFLDVSSNLDHAFFVGKGLTHFAPYGPIPMLQIFLLLVGFVVLAGLIIWLDRERRQAPPAIDPQTILLLHQRLESFNQDVKSSLTENTRQQQTSSFQMTSTVL